MALSKIEWTDRSDWNPIRGCTRVSPGCGGPGDHGGCYAEAMAARFSDEGQWGHGFAKRTAKGGRWTGKVELQADRLTLPMRWKRPARIFASSTSDVFHEALSDSDIDRIFAAMALAPHHTFQVLTKRSARMREYCDRKTSQAGASAVADAIKELGGTLGDQLAFMERMAEHSCLPNVWLGVSVEDQMRADERVPDLVAISAVVRFISAEPLLGLVDLRPWLRRLQWVITGGESGQNARPLHPLWPESIQQQCANFGVAFLHKQWGEYMAVEYVEGHDEAFDYRFLDGTGRLASSFGTMPRFEEAHGADFVRIGKKAAGRMLDGREWSEFPA